MAPSFTDGRSASPSPDDSKWPRGPRQACGTPSRSGRAVWSDTCMNSADPGGSTSPGCADDGSADERAAVCSDSRADRRRELCADPPAGSRLEHLSAAAKTAHEASEDAGRDADDLHRLRDQLETLRDLERAAEAGRNRLAAMPAPSPPRLFRRDPERNARRKLVKTLVEIGNQEHERWAARDALRRRLGAEDPAERLDEIQRLADRATEASRELRDELERTLDAEGYRPPTDPSLQDRGSADRPGP